MYRSVYEDPENHNKGTETETDVKRALQRHFLVLPLILEMKITVLMYLSTLGVHIIEKNKRLFIISRIGHFSMIFGRKGVIAAHSSIYNYTRNSTFSLRPLPRPREAGPRIRTS